METKHKPKKQRKTKDGNTLTKQKQTTKQLNETKQPTITKAKLQSAK